MKVSVGFCVTITLCVAGYAKTGMAAQKPMKWVYCSYQREGVAYATDLTEVFAIPTSEKLVSDAEWYKAFEAQTKSKRSTRLSCPSDDTREKSEARRRETIAFYRARGAEIGALTAPSIGAERSSKQVAPNAQTQSTVLGRHSQPQRDAAGASSQAVDLAAEKRRAVQERNRVAQQKYEAELAEQQRKVAEFERAKEQVAREKAEQQAAAQRAQDAFKAEQAAYAEKLLRHQQEVSEHQAKMIAHSGGASSANGGGGKFQATSQIVDTREAAMAGLMRQPVPGPLSDIQCVEVKMYSPPKWTCSGFYYQDRKPAAGSAQ